MMRLPHPAPNAFPATDSLSSAWASCLPPVDLSAIANAHDRDNQVGIENLVQNPIVALAYAVLLVAAEFLDAWRSRVIGKASDLRSDPLTISGRHAFQFPGGRLGEQDAITCHAS